MTSIIYGPSLLDDNEAVGNRAAILKQVCNATPFNVARSLVLDLVKPLPAHTVDLIDGCRAVLAQDFRATQDSPRFDNSAVDGFAFHIDDLKSTSDLLPVIDDIPAGDSRRARKFAPNFAMAISTGAPVPAGVAAIEMIENVWHELGRVRLRATLTLGRNIRRRGEEFRTGDLLLKNGDVLNSASLGMLASQGQTRVEVIRPPKVGLLVTGNELLPSSKELREGQIYDSNSVTIVAEIHASGITDITVVRCGDDVDCCRKQLSELIESCDLVITTGGVSVGQHDPIRAACKDLDIEQVLWRVAMKPGKPFYAARPTLGVCQAVIGLPGNPLAALIAFRLLVAPIISKMCGHQLKADVALHRTARTAIRSDKGKTEFIPCVMDGRFVGPAAKIRSHMLSGLASANCLAVFGDESDGVTAGEAVQVIPW